MPRTPKGVRLGGRQKGTPNKATKVREQLIASSGLTPLGYMLKVLRDPKSKTEERRWAAQTAAPYVHPRLAAHSVTSQSDNRLEIVIIDPTRGILTQSMKANGIERLEGRRTSIDAPALPAPADLAVPRLVELLEDGEAQDVDSEGADNHLNDSNEGES